MKSASELQTKRQKITAFNTRWLKRSMEVVSLISEETHILGLSEKWMRKDDRDLIEAEDTQSNTKQLHDRGKGLVGWRSFYIHCCHT